MYGHWRGSGSHLKGIHSRRVGDVDDGFLELSLRPNWSDLEDRREDYWQDVPGASGVLKLSSSWRFEIVRIAPRLFSSIM